MNDIRRPNLIGVVFGLLIAASSVDAAIPASERAALIAFYNSTNGAAWTNNTGWLGASAGTECGWFGITCNDAGGRVIRIDLPNNNLAGTIPDAIGDFSNLEAFMIKGNGVSGSIRIGVTRLANLTSLDVSENDLSGTIPSEIGNLTKLTYFDVTGNALSGPVPPSVGNLTEVYFFGTCRNQLTGTIPDEITNLTKLTVLTFCGNEMEGPLPANFGNLTQLNALSLEDNRFSGDLPASLWDIKTFGFFSLWGNDFSGPISPKIAEWTSLGVFQIDGNRFSGAIPDVFQNLNNIEFITLTSNEFSGPFPASLGSASKTKLTDIRFDINQFSGPLPESLATLPALENLGLSANQFTGPIPSSYGSIPKLKSLNLDSNLLSGNVPEQLANLTTLELFQAQRNQFRGVVGRQFLSLAGASGFYLDNNVLTPADDEVRAFLDQRGNFTFTQTIAPTGVTSGELSPYSAEIIWQPIPYNFDAGGYQVLVSTSADGPFTPLVTTPDKAVDRALVTGLQPSTTYYFVVKTVTFPFGGRSTYQLNTLFSDASAMVSATTPSATSSPAQIVVSTPSAGLVQLPNIGGAVDSYTLTNVGGQASTISLSKSGTFFEQQPTLFTLEPGASQQVVLTGNAVAEGTYAGSSSPSGSGVPAGLTIAVQMISSDEVSGDYLVTSSQARIDLVAPEGQNPAGTIQFRNDGAKAFTGVASSDVQFVVPQSGLITIPPGATIDVQVSADRENRPDSELLNGSQQGRLTLFAVGGISSRRFGPRNGSPSASLVTVVDTVKPATTITTIPPILPDEIALFVPSVGHVQGSVGLFLSDLSILNPNLSSRISDLKLLFTPVGAQQSTSASLNAIDKGVTVSLADVVKSVFDVGAGVGTLQVRSKLADTLSVSASVFNVSNPAGNYGTTIPVFRSDRSAKPGEELFLTGLRQDSGRHSNIYIQETTGATTSVKLDYLSPGGAILGSTTSSVAAFELGRFFNALSEGAVACRVTNLGGGNVVAYATPVDVASGDTWAVADWSRLYSYDPAGPVVIAVGGAAKGANGTDFHTDVTITNRCAVAIQDPGTLVPCRELRNRAELQYYPRSGGVLKKKLEIGLLGTAVLEDVVRNTFGVTSDSVGFLKLVPENGSFAVTSHTYTLSADGSQTYGMAVPAVGTTNALRPGQSRRIGGLNDAEIATISEGVPASQRTNFGFAEVDGQPARVRVSVFFNDPRSLAAGAPAGTITIDLAPNEFRQLNRLVQSVLGPTRDALFGDLTGVSVRFDVIGTTGAVLVYTTSIDNGTGDSVLRTE